MAIGTHIYEIEEVSPWEAGRFALLGWLLLGAVGYVWFDEDERVYRNLQTSLDWFVQHDVPRTKT